MNESFILLRGWFSYDIEKAYKLILDLFKEKIEEKISLNEYGTGLSGGNSYIILYGKSEDFDHPSNKFFLRYSQKGKTLNSAIKIDTDVMMTQNIERIRTNVLEGFDLWLETLQKKKIKDFNFLKFEKDFRLILEDIKNHKFTDVEQQPHA
jgi:hypothetical protein